MPVPEESTGLPESRFLVADVLIRFDHALGTAGVIRGDADEVSSLLARPAPRLQRTNGRRGFARRTPGREDYEALVRTAQEHIRAGDVFQVVLSQRAERSTSASALELYRALRRINPSPYLFLLELDGLALIGSSPDRARPGRRRAPARLGEGPRRARHARRPRAQRPVTGLCPRYGRGRALLRGRAVLPRDAPRLAGGR